MTLLEKTCLELRVYTKKTTVFCKVLTRGSNPAKLKQMAKVLRFDTGTGVSSFFYLCDPPTVLLPPHSPAYITFRNAQSGIFRGTRRSKIIYHHGIQSGFHTAQKYALTYIRSTYIFTKSGHAGSEPSLVWSFFLLFCFLFAALSGYDCKKNNTAFGN